MSAMLNFLAISCQVLCEHYGQDTLGNISLQQVSPCVQVGWQVAQHVTATDHFMCTGEFCWKSLSLQQKIHKNSLPHTKQFVAATCDPKRASHGAEFVRSWWIFLSTSDGLRTETYLFVIGKRMPVREWLFNLVVLSCFDQWTLLFWGIIN